MTYPKTDEEWEQLAECIVTKHPSVSPEYVGGLTVDATQTIFSWYKGEDRRRALDKRQRARDDLMELAKEARCISGVGSVRACYYWEATNMAIGEIAQSSTERESLTAAVQDARNTLDKDFRHWKNNHVVIKVFTQSPGERYGLTYEPVHTESFWVSEYRPSEFIGGVGYVGQRVRYGMYETPSSRPFPQTYGDWVNLAEDIKAKDPSVAFMVNAALEDISNETEYADPQKRWLVNKAGELGIG